MVSGPSGFALALIVAGSAAVLTLILVKLWPKESDAPERIAAKMLQTWRRFTGIDDAAPPVNRSTSR